MANVLLYQPGPQAAIRPGPAIGTALATTYAEVVGLGKGGVNDRGRAISLEHPVADDERFLGVPGDRCDPATLGIADLLEDGARSADELAEPRVRTRLPFIRCRALFSFGMFCSVDTGRRN